MNNELVKELASVRTWLAASDEYAIGVPSAEVSVAVIDRAIAFISSHDSVRDRALEEAAQKVREFAAMANNTVSAALLRSLAEHIRALKSAPFTRKDGTTSPEPQMYERHKGSIAAYHTDDTRGTVEDRRKSDKGHCRGQRKKEQIFGRRPGDRARWTGEAAPVVEDRCPICGMNEGCSHTLPERQRATAAQEAPQSLGWRCFHCDEVFTDKAAAAVHFGGSECDTPACKVSPDLAALLRMQEQELYEHRQEQTKLGLLYYRFGAEHSTALRKAEQEGYDKGLKDGREHDRRQGAK